MGEGWSGKLGLTKLSFYIELINNKVLLDSTENYIQYPMINHNRKEFLKSKAFRGQITCLRLLYSQKLAWSGFEDFPGGSAVKNPPAMQEPQEATVSIPRLGRSTEGRNGNPLQCYCLENPMDPALSNAEPELLTSTLFSLISLFLHSFIYSIVHSCMHQTFSESL